jgi:hypothetical protein
MRLYPMNAWAGAVVTPLAAFRRQLWHSQRPLRSAFWERKSWMRGEFRYTRSRTLSGGDSGWSSRTTHFGINGGRTVYRGVTY